MQQTIKYQLTFIKRGWIPFFDEEVVKFTSEDSFKSEVRFHLSRGYLLQGVTSVSVEERI